MLKNEREKLEKEISEIWERSMKYSYGYFEDDELLKLREALQPAVDGWNDGEDEYQHMVDIFGGGTDEYNYDQYFENKAERILINKINTMNVRTYFTFMPQEEIDKINIAYIEHKTGATLRVDYDNHVIIINK